MRRIFAIRRTKDFRTLFRYGKRRESRYGKILFLPNNTTSSRFAFITPKTIDKRSVVRNRIRRRAREWVRKDLTPPSPPFDIAVLFKKESREATKKDFYEDLAELFHFIF